MDPALTIACISGAVALGGGYLSYRAASQANRTADKKVDAEAYDRSVAFYEKVMADADKQLDRMRAQIERLTEQFDKVSSQLAQEQDTSFSLRDQIRALRGQVGVLEMMVTELRAQLAAQSGGTHP